MRCKIFKTFALQSNIYWDICQETDHKFSVSTFALNISICVLSIISNLSVSQGDDIHHGLFCRPLIAAQLLLVDEVIWSGCKYVEGLGWLQYVSGDYVCSSIPIAPCSMLYSCGIYSNGLSSPLELFDPSLCSLG